MPEPDDISKIVLEELRALRTSMETRLSGVELEVANMKASVAQLQATEAQQEKNIMSFWAENWGPLKADIQDIKNRLSSLEQKDVIELERRIDALEREKATLNQKLADADKLAEEQKLDARVQAIEKREAKRLGLAAGAGLASGGVARLMEWLLGGSGG